MEKITVCIMKGKYECMHLTPPRDNSNIYIKNVSVPVFQEPVVKTGSPNVSSGSADDISNSSGKTVECNSR